MGFNSIVRFFFYCPQHGVEHSFTFIAPSICSVILYISQINVQ